MKNKTHELFKLGRAAIKAREVMQSGSSKAKAEYIRLAKEQNATHKEMNQDFLKDYR